MVIKPIVKTKGITRTHKEVPLLFVVLSACFDRPQVFHLRLPIFKPRTTGLRLAKFHDSRENFLQNYRPMGRVDPGCARGKTL